MADSPMLWDLLEEDLIEPILAPASATYEQAATSLVSHEPTDILGEEILEEVEVSPELPTPAATAISQKLAPGGGGGGCWLGGPKTSSTEKWVKETGETPKDFSVFGHNLFGADIKPEPGGRLAERFTLPPFSVLDARQGVWQDRKRAWLSLGIQSELGRGGGTWVESSVTGSPADRQQGYREQAVEDERASERASERVASFKNQDKLTAFMKNR